MISSKSLKNKEIQYFSPLSTTFPHLPPLWPYFGIGQAFIWVFVEYLQGLESGASAANPPGEWRGLIVPMALSH